MDPAAVLGGLVPSWSAAVVLVSYLAAAGAVFPGKLVAGLPESSRFAHPRPRLRLLLRRRDHLHRGERPHAAHQPCASPPSFPRRHRPARVCLVILLLLIKASRASRAGQIQPWWPRSSSLTSCSALPEPADDLRGHPSPRWWAKEVRVSGEFVVPISDSVLDDGEVATVEPRSKFGTCPSVRDAVLSSTAVILTSPSILLGIDSIGEPSSRLLAQCLH